MKKLLSSCSALLAVCVLAVACSSNKEAAPASRGVGLTACVMSGEPIDAGVEAAMYNGAKVGFCCDKCKMKWEKLDDAGKKAAYTKATTK